MGSISTYSVYVRRAQPRYRHQGCRQARRKPAERPIPEVSLILAMSLPLPQGCVHIRRYVDINTLSLPFEPRRQILGGFHFVKLRTFSTNGAKTVVERYAGAGRRQSEDSPQRASARNRKWTLVYALALTHL